MVKELYEGVFNVEIKIFVLLMGLKYDVLSLIVGVYNVSVLFVNSVVIEVQGVGYMLYSLFSICVGRYILVYWINGILLKDNVKCEVDINFWDKVRIWIDVFENLCQKLEEQEEGSMFLEDRVEDSSDFIMNMLYLMFQNVFLELLVKLQEKFVYKVKFGI